jgi:putative DNA primase/helicase
VGGLTPARLRFYLVDVLEDKATNDGLMQRLQLLVWPDVPPSWKYIDRLPDAAAAQTVQRVFEKLVRLDADAPCLLKFCDSAQALFDRWLSNLETRIRTPEEHPAMVSHLAKYRGLMPSLAGLFCLIELAAKQDTSLLTFFDIQPQLISLDQARRAVDWCAYLEPNARRVYSCIVSPAVRSAHELVFKLKAGKLGHGTFRVREVYLKGWSGLDTPERARQALSILEDADWIRPVQANSTVGRPPEEFQINPRVFTDAPDTSHQNHQNSADVV